MDKKTILVKEVVCRMQETAEITGNIITPLPIKEIYEVKHHISSQDSQLGMKSVAYFGDINFKIIYIDNNDNCLRQIEQALPYKGISFLKNNENSFEPEIRVKTYIQDIFAAKDGAKSIKVNGFLTLEIIITREKELCIGELASPEVNSGQEDKHTESQMCSKDIFTEVKEGIEENITITIE